jgi:hypothetical protein
MMKTVLQTKAGAVNVRLHEVSLRRTSQFSLFTKYYLGNNFNENGASET